MTKPKVIVYSYELPNCPCYKEIFTEFEILPADSEKDFLVKIRGLAVDAAVVCFCSCSEKDVEKLPMLNALTGPIPLFVCSKSASRDIIFHAGQTGIENFLFCDSNLDEIPERVHHAIRKGSLRRRMEQNHPGFLAKSAYSHKIIELIIQYFPSRLKEADIAEKLGKSVRWLESQVLKAFSKSYSKLIRRIWVYEALCMMMNTGKNNSQIAFELTYAQESHMARDFRKELALSPHEARELILSGKKPEDLMK